MEDFNTSKDMFLTAGYKQQLQTFNLDTCCSGPRNGTFFISNACKLHNNPFTERGRIRYNVLCPRRLIFSKPLFPRKSAISNLSWFRNKTLHLWCVFPISSDSKNPIRSFVDHIPQRVNSREVLCSYHQIYWGTNRSDSVLSWLNFKMRTSQLIYHPNVKSADL